jgi:hypothetical protein
VDDNLVSKLDVYVMADTLHIALRNGAYQDYSLRAEVTMPQMTGVKLNGASRLRGELAGERLTLDLNGASRATLTGAADRVSVEVNGASQALLGGLDAAEIELDANGASRVEVKTAGQVRGRANGASTINVSGPPSSVDIKAEGASRVTTR